MASNGNTSAYKSRPAPSTMVVADKDKDMEVGTMTGDWKMNIAHENVNDSVR
jgi:hypothetical protein